MTLLKQKEREQAFNIRRITEPDLTLDKVKLPNDLEIWAMYEDAAAIYQDQLKAYEYQDKLARETFPEENKKVFPALIQCISTASVQDLRLSVEGGKYFEEHDAYNFFKLAIKEHAHLPDTISAAAVTRAKEQLEGLRQKSEDTIAEHANEFRRRLEVLQQAKGTTTDAGYADYELRDLLVRSLYSPMWTPWIENREDTDTMPATFEDLVLALKKAETKRILRSPSPIAAHMPSAHVTRTIKKGDSSPTTTSSTPTRCQVCGKPFCPRRSSHLRCDLCQSDFSSKAKKSGKSSSTAPDKNSKRSPTKKAHSTVVNTAPDNPSSSDDDEEPDLPVATAHFTSFSCICSSRGSITPDDVIYLDNCSNLNIIRDSSVALNLRQDPLATRITGSIPGTLSSQLSADIGDLGRGCYDPKFSRNLLSEDSVLRAGYRITRDSSADNNYYLHKPGRPPLIFSANNEGTFSIPISTFLHHFKDLYASAHVTDVDRTSLVFTKRQRERAAAYHHDHSHSLCHVHPDKVILALRKGLILNVPYTEADVRNALVIHGPSPTCTRSKGTRHRQVGHYPSFPASPGEHLAGDLFTIMGILFSLISCRLIKLRCVTRLRNKGVMELTRAIRDCVNVWKGYGATPKVLSWDQEPALVSCAAELWAQHSLRVQFTSPDAHERLVEREVGTIKEHVYASILDLRHAVDDEMVEGIVRDTVTLLNFFPNFETVDGSPRTYLDGERLDYSRWSRVHAGQVAHFEIPYAHSLSPGSRRELGYVICHQGDNPVVRLLPAGRRLVIRSGHIAVVEKTPAIIKLIEEGITGAKRQRYNDLLAEIEDFYAAQPYPSESQSDALATPAIAPPPPTFDPVDPSDALSPQEPAPSIIAEPSPPLPDAPPPSPEQPPTLTPEPPVHPEPPVIPSTLSVTPPRRSSRPGAAKPPGYYARLHSGESAADYTACHLQAAECSRLYGAKPTKAAGLTEVLNMIKVRQAAFPQDYRKLSPSAIRAALPSFLFYKAKDALPDADSPPPLIPYPSPSLTDAQTSWTPSLRHCLQRTWSVPRSLRMPTRHGLPQCLSCSSPPASWAPAPRRYSGESPRTPLLSSLGSRESSSGKKRRENASTLAILAALIVGREPWKLTQDS